MSADERDHLVTARATQREDDHLNHCRDLPILIILTSVSSAVPDGFMYSTSYLIGPVCVACTPPWSNSATIYGTAAIAAGSMLGGFFAILMNRKRPRLYFLLSGIGYALVMSITGIMVMYCHDLMLAGEMTYIVMFGIYGIFATVFYLANSELAISWMPRWPGFASGLHGTSQTIGSIIIPQMIIFLRKLFSNSHVNVGTIFFCLGIFKLVLSAPWLPVVSLPHTSRPSDQSGSASSLTRIKFTKQIIKKYRFWLVSLVCFSAFVPLYGVLAVQEPLLNELWHHPHHTPISSLSLIIMGCYLVGRLLCLVYSDMIGLQQVWFLALFAQGVLLSCLGFLFLEPMPSSQKNLRFSVLCLYFIVFPVFKSTMAGFVHDIFGSHFRLIAVGILTFVSGVAGVIGPIAVDAIHTHFNSYMMFFFGTAALSMTGALSLLAVCLPVTPISTVQDSESETAADN